MTKIFKDKYVIYNEILYFFDSYFKTNNITDEIYHTIEETANFYSRFLFELENIIEDKLYIAVPSINFGIMEININLVNYFNSDNSFIYFNTRANDKSNMTITNEFKKLQVNFRSEHDVSFDVLMRDYLLDDFLNILTNNDFIIKETLNKNMSIHNIVKQMKNIKQELPFVDYGVLNLFKEKNYTTTKEIFDACKPLADIVSLTHDINIHNDLIILKNYINNKQNQKITYE